MRAHEIDPAATAMAVLVQRMSDAEGSGGALSRTPEDELLVTGTWGLGSVIAQGEVVPDRFVLRRDGVLDRVEPGRKDRLVAASRSDGPQTRAVRRDLVGAPCLCEGPAVARGEMVLAVETALGSPLGGQWAQGAP